MILDIIVSPDVGGIKRAAEYAKILNKGMAIVVKERLSDTEVEVVNFIGNVKGKKILMVDDLTESCNTLIEAAKECKSKGAIEINVAVTHGCFSTIGILNLDTSLNTKLFDKMFYSNTISNIFNFKTYHGNKLVEVDVSPVFATAIQRIHNNESVSELFNV